MAVLRADALMIVTIVASYHLSWGLETLGILHSAGADSTDGVESGLHVYSE